MIWAIGGGSLTGKFHVYNLKRIKMGAVALCGYQFFHSIGSTEESSLLSKDQCCNVCLKKLEKRESEK